MSPFGIGRKFLFSQQEMMSRVGKREKDDSADLKAKSKDGDGTEKVRLAKITETPETEIPVNFKPIPREEFLRKYEIKRGIKHRMFQTSLEAEAVFDKTSLKPEINPDKLPYDDGTLEIKPNTKNKASVNRTSVRFNNKTKEDFLEEQISETEN